MKLPPAPRPFTVWRLLVQLLKHALLGRGGDTVSLVINWENTTGETDCITVDATEFSWEAPFDRMCSIGGTSDVPAHLD